MAETDKFSSWYKAEKEGERPDEERNTFREVWAAFASELSQDRDKIKWILDKEHGNFDSLIASVIEAQKAYQARKRNSKIWKGLSRFSEAVGYYGGILDVLVSHHPEYVALVYGALKFLFVGVVNDQKLLSQLSTGINDIAMILPHAQLISQLYPTQHIEKVIMALYTNILRFLLRALRWFQESTTRHVLDVFSRKSALYYDDILSTISMLSRSMKEAASASSQAEQRDMHTAITQHTCEHTEISVSMAHLISELSEVKSLLVTDQAFKATAKIDLGPQVSKVQHSQLIAYTAVTNLPDPSQLLQVSNFLLRRRRISWDSGPKFWLDERVEQWNTSMNPALIIFNGTIKVRSHLRRFAVESITLLQNAKIPVIWTLGSAMRSNNPISTIDLLKYLIHQAIQSNKSIHTNTAMASRLDTYLGAKTEEEWLDVLLFVLRGIPILYIIVDIDILSRNASTSKRDSRPGSFLKVFSELTRRSVGTVLRVALVSGGSPILRDSLRPEYDDHVVHVGNTNRPGAQMKRGGIKERISAEPSPTSSCDLNAIGGNRYRRTGSDRVVRRRKRE